MRRINKKLMNLNIGIFQYEMQNESPGEKINRLQRLLKETSPLDIVICPELFISGYGSLEKINAYSENSEGNYAKEISALAKKSNTAIIYGYPEKDDHQLFNSAQLFDRRRYIYCQSSQETFAANR